MFRIDDVHQLESRTVSLRQCASELKDVQAILGGISNKKERAGSTLPPVERIPSWVGMVASWRFL